MIVSKKLTIKTGGNGDTIDITPGVERAIAESNLASGVVTLFVVGSTAALTNLQVEPCYKLKSWNNLFRVNPYQGIDDRDSGRGNLLCLERSQLSPN